MWMVNTLNIYIWFFSQKRLNGMIMYILWGIYNSAKKQISEIVKISETQKVRLTGAFFFCYLTRVHSSLPWKITSLSLFWWECNSSSIRGQSLGPLWFYEAWAGYSLYDTKDKRHIGSTVHATHWGVQSLPRGCTYWHEMQRKKPATLKWMCPVRGS